MLWITNIQRIDLGSLDPKNVNWFDHSKAAKMVDFSGGSTSRCFRSIFNNGPWLILQEEQKTVLTKFDIPYLKATNIVDVDGSAAHFELPTCLVESVAAP